MDEEADGADNGSPPTDNGFSGLILPTASVEAPSTLMPDLIPRVEGGRVAHFDRRGEAGAVQHEGDVGDDDEEGIHIVNFEKTEQKRREKRQRDAQNPTQYSSAERVLSDDVFRELIGSIIKDFEAEHAHIDKHYTSLSNRPNFSNVKCSPHAVQVISDAFEDFMMNLLRRAHVFFSARVRTNEILEDLTLKSSTFGPDHRMLINMRICNESESKRKREHDLIESIQKQRDEEAAAEQDNVESEEQLRSQAQRVEQKKANSKVVTMEEVNKARDIMAKKGGQGLLVRSWAVKAQESFVSMVPLELEKVYSDTEAYFKKISEHSLSGQEVSNVHEIQAEIKKAALRSSRMQESDWRALRLDDIIPVMDAEPTLRRKMVTLYGHELIQSKHNAIIQEELKRRRDAAALNEEAEDQWIILRDIKKLCSPLNGCSDDQTEAAVSRLEEELTKKYTAGKLKLQAAITYHKLFIEGGKSSLKKVNPNMHRSIIITSMLSSKVAVQRLPQGVTHDDVERFLASCNVSGLKNCQFDSHGTNAVLEFHMPQFAQECVARVDAQRMRPSDSESLKVSLHEATRLEPGHILIAERYEKDVDVATVMQIFKNFANFKGTCKPAGARHCFVEFVESSACATALNKVLAMNNEIYFRYVSPNELSEYRSAREKEREAYRQPGSRLQPQTADVKQSSPPPPQPSLPVHPQQMESSSASSQSSGILYMISASGVPADISIDELKRRLSLHSGCLPQTLKSREIKQSPFRSSSLPIQEFQVQFQDDESATAYRCAIQDRPFAADRPEYGNVVVKKFVTTQEEINKRRKALTAGQPAQPPQDPVQHPKPFLSAQAPVLRESMASPAFSGTQAIAPAIVPAIVPAIPNPVLQNSADVRTYVYANNIPVMSKEDMTRKFMKYFSSGTPKVEAHVDPKAPGTCTVRVLFGDYASAQRCLEGLNGLPFSEQHDIGPVKATIKQITREQERLKRLQQQGQLQASEPTQQPNQQYVPQQLQAPHQTHVPSHGLQTMQFASPSINYAQPFMTMQPPHGQPQQHLQAHQSGIVPQQNIQLQPHPQLMMPPSNQPHQYYQPQQVHMPQQPYNPAAPQQMYHQQIHQYTHQPQLVPMHAAMQNNPAQHYAYQSQHPVLQPQYSSAVSPTAVDMQNLEMLEQEGRANQERIEALLKKAAQK